MANTPANGAQDGRNVPCAAWSLLYRAVLIVAEWIGQALKAARLQEALRTTEVALATREIRLSHHDPAGAFLAATAKVFDLTLVTSDARLIAIQGLSILPNH